MREKIIDFLKDDGRDWSRKDIRNNCVKWNDPEDMHKEFEAEFDKLKQEGIVVFTRLITASGSVIRLYKFNESG